MTTDQRISTVQSCAATRASLAATRAACKHPGSGLCPEPQGSEIRKMISTPCVETRCSATPRAVPGFPSETKLEFIKEPSCGHWRSQTIDFTSQMQTLLVTIMTLVLVGMRQLLTPPIGLGYCLPTLLCHMTPSLAGHQSSDLCSAEVHQSALKRSERLCL